MKTTKKMRKLRLLFLLPALAASCKPSSSAAGNETDIFKTQSGKKLEFTCIGHASVRLNYDGIEFQIDPVSSMLPKGYGSMPKADFILVTHEHGDHFDKQAVADLTKPSTRLVTNARCAAMLGYGETMKNGDRLTLSDAVGLEAVPAYNTTPGREQFHPKGRDNGFILTIDGFRIYIAGDTEDIPEMANIKDIDAAFMPCNQPYTMTPKQLAKAAKAVSPKTLFPYHYSDTNMEAVSELLNGSGIDVRIRNYR